MVRHLARPRAGTARLAFAVLLCLVGFASAHSAPAADLRLLSTGPASVQFSVAVPAAIFETLESDREVSALALPGYESEGSLGEPSLPVRVVTVAVPPAGAVRVQASGFESEAFENVLIASVVPETREQPGLRATAPRDRQIVERVPRRAWQAASAPAGERARLLEVTWIRNQRVARIELRPVEYDLATRRLSLFHRLEVTVQMEGVTAAGAPAEDPDPFEGVYRDVLLNYEQGKAWRRTSTRASLGGLFTPRQAGPLGAAPVPDTSIYAGRDWVKIAIRSTGFYKVAFSQVRNLSPFNGDTTTVLDSLRMFTLPGLPVLPEEGYCDSCEFREVALGIVDNGNGLFSNNTRDYIYFFALGPSDWADLYDPAQPDTTFINHPYATTNYHYLGFGSAELPFGGTRLRIPLESGSPANPVGDEVTPATFRARLHEEVDAEYWPDVTPHSPSQPATIAWEKWFWKSLDRGNAFSDTIWTPGADPTQPVRLRLRQWGLSFNSFRTFGVQDHYLDVRLNSAVLNRLGWDFFQQRTVDTSFVGLQDGANLLTVSVPFVMDPNPSNEARRVDRSALAWADLFYQRRFEPVDNELTFDSPGNGSTIYSLEPFTLDPADPGPPRVFDVTNSLAPIEVVDAAYEAIGAGTYRLRFKRIEGGPRRYRVLPSDIPEVVDSEIANAPLSSRFNLRSATQYADFLVIYYDGFRAAVDSLLRQRHERLPLTGRSAPFDTAAVPVSALYDQFSGGRTDPGAIRAFLRAAFFNWSRPGAARGSGAPAFVTMLGDASYDFKNIGGHAPAGQPASLLPTYEGGYDYSLRRQYATDDWIMNVTDDTADQRRGIPDFFEGRIPAGDASSALGYVRDKLLAFERRAPLGEWRNRIMLIADDNEQGARPDGLRWTHLCQTSRLDTINTPDHMDRVYVYLHTYPDGPGDTKPGARADMIDGINEGLSLFNYIGHGSAFKVADEGIFLESDVPSLTNLSRPSLFVAASCDIGKFHDPQFAGIGEKLVMHGTGGCVGVISATEEAFSGQNVALNKIVYDRIFARDPSDGQYHTSNAEALLSAKITTTPPGQSSTNNSKYKLLGDSGTQLNLPRRWVELSLEDENGTPVQEARRGQTLTFKGQVLDRPGGSSVPFTGVARLLIEDSAPIQSVSPADGECSIVDRDLQTYPFRAADVFRGDAGIENGRFEGRFIVPLEAKAGPMGKLRGYIEGTAGGETFLSDGVGSMAYTVSPGSPAAGDNEGPTVKLSFPGGSTSVRPDATLNVELFDPSGILITGHNLQNAIIVTLDDDPNTRIDITSSFRYAANSYQSGTASFVLPGLAPGPHNIKVSAADNLASGITAGQHRTSATIAFEVTDNPPLSVQRAFLFPNPMVSGRGTGQFVVDAPGDAVNVLIRIYTISGRLIRTLKAFGGLGQVQVAWDGLDDAGSRLAIGTYLFRVHVNPRDADGTSSSRQKAHADGRFVVVGH